MTALTMRRCDRRRFERLNESGDFIIDLAM
jgi:hypothetical protein